MADRFQTNKNFATNFARGHPQSETLTPVLLDTKRCVVNAHMDEIINLTPVKGTVCD